VVGGDHRERLGGQQRTRLGADLAALLELGQDLEVVVRAGDRGDTVRVTCRGTEEGRPGDVDHLDRAVDPDQSPSDLRPERSDVADDDVDRLDALAPELLQLIRLVAPGEDPRVDRVMERLDLAVEHRRDAGELGHGSDLDAVLGEVLAGAVGGEELEVERLQAAGEDRDAIARCDREERSHPHHPPRRAGSASQRSGHDARRGSGPSIAVPVAYSSRRRGW
jgi:hypothetical protein